MTPTDLKINKYNYFDYIRRASDSKNLIYDSNCVLIDDCQLA